MSKQQVLGPRFEAALALAFQLHAKQARKSSGVPYISHLLAVAALVLEDGGSEDEAIAALLHDAVEDQGGQKTLDIIRAQFGERVAETVLACSDADTMPKPPWRARKEAHIAHLRSAGASVRRVVAADKLHNARTTLADYRTQGEQVWDRFKGGKDGTLWYYRAVHAALAGQGAGVLVDELGRVLDEMELLASR
ncbi:MAG: bifunctional (p)ppGpp synthetase/guanosine-3',5'-bis(diphosphate) 3'-pyrophosphohydrolase [Anaerolineae bacterium]|nr:MAG: bifunctional (p)ppGpp synthetase/guanosine-3',5'-bis(diphosphate) 3'-pyrophosphohydrolase [Anaerolineae bacterium]